MLTTQIGMNSHSIKLVPYDPQWADVFECDKERLQRHLHKYKDIKIHHVGSTSMPTVPKAKPVIDILVGADNYSDLVKMGYKIHDKGFRSKWFRKQDDCGQLWRATDSWLYMGVFEDCNSWMRTNNIHFATFSGSQYDNFLLFKRYLIEHPDEAQRYFELKEKMAQKYSCSSCSYSAGKQKYIETINTKARQLYAGQEL